MKYRSHFALILGLAFLSACSGTGTQGLIPQGGTSQDRGSMSVAPPTASSPAPLAVLAGVNIDQTGLLPVFKLASATACFGGTPAAGGGGGGGDDDNNSEGDHHRGDGDTHGWGDGHHDRDSHDGDREHHRGHHHHHGSDDGGGSGGGGTGGTAPTFGAPFTPASNLTAYIGAFSLTDPCGAIIPVVGGLGLASAVRNPMATIPAGNGAYIIYLDSTDTTQTAQILVGPATAAGSTYTFASPRLSHTFRAGHTYTFALAGPAPAASPTPSPTPTPSEHDD